MSTYISEILSIFISYFCSIKRKCQKSLEAKLNEDDHDGHDVDDDDNDYSIKYNHERLMPLLKNICTNTILDRKNINFNQSRMCSTESQKC